MNNGGLLLRSVSSGNSQSPFRSSLSIVRKSEKGVEMYAWLSLWHSSIFYKLRESSFIDMDKEQFLSNRSSSSDKVTFTFGCFTVSFTKFKRLVAETKKSQAWHSLLNSWSPVRCFYIWLFYFVIVPVFKRGDWESPSIYRGISLLNTILYDWNYYTRITRKI